MIDKWEVQVDPKYGEIKKEIKDGKYIFMDAHSNIDADDLVVSFKEFETIAFSRFSF